MKKIFVYLVLILLGALSVNALETGVVVELPDGKVYAECVDLSEGSTAYDAFKIVDEHNDNIKMDWTGTGSSAFLKEINNIGYNEYGNGNSWAFTTVEPGSSGFDIPPDKAPGISYGIGSYPLKEGGLIGLSHSKITFDIDWTIKDISPKPTDIPFSSLCNFGITRVKVDPKKPKPGEEVKVDVSLENNFDFDLEDIELKVWFEENGKKLEDDDNDDIEEDSSFDLDSEDDEDDLDDEDHIFTFEMPFDVDDNDEYNVYVTLEAEQANDSSIIYRALDFSKTIKFEREKHELEIFKFLVNPEELKCNRNINLEVGLRNLGEKDEDVTFKLYSPELGIDKTETFELESDADDNEYKNNYYLKVNEDVTAGDYLVTLKAEYNDANDYVTKTTSIRIEDCEKTETVETNLQGNVVLETPETTSQKETIETTEQFKVSNNIIIIAALGFVIVITFGGLLVAKLLR